LLNAPTRKENLMKAVVFHGPLRWTGSRWAAGVSVPFSIACGTYRNCTAG
jgi:hypothetical protein